MIEVVVALIAALAVIVPSLLVFISQSRKSTKAAEKLFTITEEKATRDKQMSAWRVKRENLLDERAFAYELYDKEVKGLALIHAQMYLQGAEDKSRLTAALKLAEDARREYKRQTESFHRSLQEITDEMLRIV
jgi:hypothetical protein